MQGKTKQPNPFPNMGKMSISGTNKFIMERARAVGNIPAMKKAHAVAPKGVSYKQAGMQGKSTKLATGGPSNMRVAGKPFNKKTAMPSSRGPVMKGQKVIASNPEAMAKSPTYRQRTLGEPEFGEYRGGTGKHGRA